MARTEIEQEMANRLKVLRTITRLKHSLAADTELNRTVDTFRTNLSAQAQAGGLQAMTLAELIAIGTGVEDAAV